MSAACANQGVKLMSVTYQTQETARSDRFVRWLRSTPAYIAVLAIAFLWTLPTLGIFISSFRPPSDIATSGWWTVFQHPFDFTQYTLENYERVMTTSGMGDAFVNSLLVTIPAVVIPITIAAFAAYAFAWLEFPGRRFLFVVVVGLMVVPLQMSLIPLLRLYVNVGDATGISLNGSLLGVWLAHTGFGLPLAIFLLFGYISSLPREIIESAHVDGASPLTTFTRLVLPLSVPVIASFAIFQFLWVWNDLLVALVFLGTNPQRAVLTAKLSALVGERGQDWHLLTAGAFVTMIIPLIVFFALQRYFVRGLTAGSVKG
ncbi:MAG: carbohydrate ABC transporter permease [Chloroflexota bacterium]|nr:MAG: carbohydrate ABC transporter permease [Chloroflexota bacterium]